MKPSHLGDSSGNGPRLGTKITKTTKTLHGFVIFATFVIFVSRP
jgi:hypothetical protein